MLCPKEECDNLALELEAATLAVQALEGAVEALTLALGPLQEELTNMRTLRDALEAAIEECECEGPVEKAAPPPKKVVGAAKVFARGALNMAFNMIGRK